MISYLLRHLQVLFYTLGQLTAAPLATLMTIAVIGITLALPSGLYVLLDNMQRMTAHWEGGAQISLFLQTTTSDSSAQKLAEKLRRTPGVVEIEYLSAKDALVEFKELSGFGEALDALDSNPLPPVLVVWPAPGYNKPEALEALRKSFSKFGEVDIAQLDLEWVKRLHIILRLAQRGVLLLGGLLGMAVLLVISNTIRLAIFNRKDEIQIIKLIGGTDAFIQRPFLYSGWLQGTLGAVMAWLLVTLGLALLVGPIGDLAILYGSQFNLANMAFGPSMTLLGIGGGLGWLASRIAVGRHLRAIEPT